MQTNFRYDKPLGYFQYSLSTVQTLATICGGSIPAGTAGVLIQSETNGIRWRDDGTDPTASVGYPLAVGSELLYQGNVSALHLVSQSGTATVNVVCFG